MRLRNRTHRPWGYGNENESIEVLSESRHRNILFTLHYNKRRPRWKLLNNLVLFNVIIVVLFLKKCSRKVNKREYRRNENKVFEMTKDKYVFKSYFDFQKAIFFYQKNVFQLNILFYELKYLLIIVRLVQK